MDDKLLQLVEGDISLSIVANVIPAKHSCAIQRYQEITLLDAQAGTAYYLACSQK